MRRLAELHGRFGIEVVAFVLTDNNKHLLLRTWDANLTEAIRRQKVSWSRGGLIAYVGTFA